MSDKIRAAFERAMIHDFKCVVGSADPYPAGLERDWWMVWRKAWQAALAKQAAPAAPAVQEPAACCPYCAGSSGRCDMSFPHPPAAELLDDLQRKAKAATPGPWAVNPLDIEYEDNSIYASTLSNGTRRLICTVSTGSSAPGNRAHIAAASPAVVDALVEHIRSLTERMKAAEKDAGRYRWLRDSCQDVADEYGTAGQLYFGTYHAGRLDAAIDAAIAQEGSHE